MSVLSSIDEEFRLKKEIQDLIDNSIEQSRREVQKESETSIKQQVLILYYLGFLKEIDLDTTKKSKLISKLLNRHEQNIRACLTYIDSVKVEESDIKTKGNLEVVRNIFEQVGMANAISLIDKDLENIYKLK
jgi:ribosomal protein S8